MRSDLGDKQIRLLNRIAIFFGILYFFSMFAYPWVKGGLSWPHVHNVWMDWQTLNAGVLAFSASIIAFNISKYHADQQREREFIAARSFLPEALSELVSYFQSSAIMLSEAWERVSEKADERETPLNSKAPDLPTNHREIFSCCISLAEPKVADYLSRILIRLQVHHARVKDLHKNFEPASSIIVTKPEIISYLYRLAELQALVGKVFDYSRGLEKFNTDPLTWDDFNNAYANLGIWADELDDLEGFTKRAIENSNKDQNTA